MYRYPIKLVLVIIILIATACSTSKDRNVDTTSELQTSLVKANFELENNSFASPAEIFYRVQIERDELSGEPKEVKLSFNIRSGSTEVYLSSRSLTLIVGEETFDWPRREWNNIRNSPPVRGNITTVQLDYDDLVIIANARMVKGNLSGKDFKWSYQNREPIRQLIAKADSKY